MTTTSAVKRSSGGRDPTLTRLHHSSSARKTNCSSNLRKKSQCHGKTLQPVFNPTWAKHIKYLHCKCASNASENECAYGPTQTLEHCVRRRSTGHRTSSTSSLKRSVYLTSATPQHTANGEQMLEFGAQEKWTARQCARKWAEIDPAPPTPYPHFDQHLQHSFAPYTMTPVESSHSFMPYMNVQ
jgi:hypothetical protein